jgi:hypothetical protein
MVEGSGALTQTGMITGTPQYMAPEQATGQTVDQRVDIYALGVVAYEMLTGRVPFSADTPVAVLMKHVTEPMPIPPPSAVPEPLVRALLRSMAKKPEDRWPTAGAFVQSLQQGLAEVPTAALPVAATTMGTPAVRPPTPRTMPPPPPTARHAVARSRSGPGLILGALAALLVLGAIGFVAVGRSRPAPKTTTASLSSGGAKVSASVAPAAAPIPPPETPPATVAPPTPSAAPVTGSVTAPSAAPTRVAMPQRRPTPVPAATPPVVTTLPAIASAEPRLPAPAPVPPATTPLPVPGGPTGTLQLDVDAQQDAYTAGASTLYLKLLVDGRPFRDLSIVFEGRETSRARKRQVFEVPGIPLGRRRITLMASASPDQEKDRPEGITDVEVGPGSNRAVVQVRYNGVRFREK